jgi:hypothetical protein
MSLYNYFPISCQILYKQQIHGDMSGIMCHYEYSYLIQTHGSKVKCAQIMTCGTK